MRVQVVAPDPAWPAMFSFEAWRIHDSLGRNVVELHHIGSTAITGIVAKPVVDMLLVVRDLQLLDESSPSMIRLGYEPMGEFGIPGRRYFRKNSDEGERTHQVHGFLCGSADIERHLAFRDYMNANPSAAQAYSRLKTSLAAAHPDSIDAYMDGKNAFVKEHELKALAWRQHCGRPA